jgi:hypothetical protein
MLISRKFNTLRFLAIVVTRKLSALGAGLYGIKNSLFFLPLAHEYRKFVENRMQ